MRKLSTVLLTILLARGADPSWEAQESTSEEWRPLFNRKDLEGWDTYLGPPLRALNVDPHRNFSVVEGNGEKLIRIAGRQFGGLVTREEFRNFHLRVEFKWGDQRWTPRQNEARDSGILYHGVGPHGAGGGAWMRSVECNLMEKGCGQWRSVAGAMADVEGDRVSPDEEAELPYQKEWQGERLIAHRKGAPRMTADSGDVVTPLIDPEKPRGEWNVVEVICWGSDAIHLVNGRRVMTVRNTRYRVDGCDFPLSGGKIQLRSEGAEIFFRRVEILSLKEVPEEHRGEFPNGGKGEEGFCPLFDREHLADWVQCGPGKFTVENGVATGEGGMGLWWYRKKSFANFVLRGEFQQEKLSDSGVFVRFPDPGSDPWVAVKQGHEIEIGDPRPSKGSTGSIYPFTSPTELPLRPWGAWNDYEITRLEKQYQVRLNGTLVTDYLDREGRPLRGYIGLQNFPYPGTVRHRNLRIREVQ